MWAVFRFSPLISVLHILFISVSGIVGVYFGETTPFMSELEDSLLRMQIFLFLVSLTSLTLIALITEQKYIRNELEILTKNLEFQVEEDTSKIKILSGILPICASCKKIRDKDDKWANLEDYIDLHSEAKLSHGYCPECAQKILDSLD